MRKSFALAVFFSFTILSCVDKIDILDSQNSPNLPSQTYDYKSSAVNLRGFATGATVEVFHQTNFNSFENPKVTDEGATLGRVLFYDKNLSLNNAVSCASCHKQEYAFADPVAKSIGFEGRKTIRNSMAVINSGMNDNLFWDSRATSVVDLTLQPVVNHLEMGIENMRALENKLQRLDYYPELFNKAFGSSEVTEARIASAMSQFLCSMTSFNSKYDKGEKENFSNFTELEKLGKKIFFSDRAMCSQCHQGKNFNAPENSSTYGGSVKGTANVGLELVYNDPGKENGNFKIPTLRNIELTAPYMHDGRFNTLDEVLEHYSHNIQPNPDLDKKFRNPNGSVKHLKFDAIEKKALIAFLKTLTDEDYIRDERFSDPFKS